MTIKNITTAMAVSALAFVGCTADEQSKTAGVETSKTKGGVEFNLDISDSDSVDTIDLNIMCAGLNQDHVLDVTDGNVVAAFGGLAEGECTVSLSATSAENYDCAGTETFTVVADDVVSVPVTLVCVGENNEAGGGAKIKAEFEINECAEDRILKLYAIPSNVLTGSSTQVEAETQNIVGTASFSWATDNDATHTATADLSAAAACAAGSAACQTALCTGLGSAQTVDPDTQLPIDGVWITLTVEDDECVDTERVWIECLQGSVCGDGVVEGAEECDDANTTANDGCENDCTITIPCGNGVLDAGEQCDGDLGLTDPAVQECDDNTCQIVAICGNNILEGGEDCDDGNLVDGDGCESDCTVFIDPNAECFACLNSGDLAGFTQGFCAPDTGALCDAALTCIVESGCWTDGGAVSDCYCGDDVTAATCEAPTYTPVGACADEIYAAAGDDSPANATVLQRYFDTLYPLGFAGQIMSQAQTDCTVECGFPTTP